MARPVHFVKEEGGRFVLGAEALDLLRGIEGPVAVVAVCGRARQVGGLGCRHSQLRAAGSPRGRGGA